MPVMDEFKEEREALKHGTPKQKFAYFLDYYKWHVIIAVAVIGFAASLIYQSVTRKETAFFAAVVNAFEMVSPEEHIQSFADYAGIDRGEYDVAFDSSIRIDNSSMTQDTITSTQKLMVLIAASEIDVVLGDDGLIEQYAYNDSFYDIREVLTQEQIEKYESRFFYMDQAVAEAISAAQEDPNYDYSKAPTHPNPKKPEAMERPVPVGIYLDGADSLEEVYYFLDGDAVLAVSATSPNLDTVPKYVDFLLDPQAAEPNVPEQAAGH